MENLINKKVLIRADRAGVFFGELIAKDGQEATLKDARRIYYWNGATECCQAVRYIPSIATEGIASGSRVTVSVPQVTILNVIEIYLLTDKAIEKLYEWPVWRK